MGSLSMCVCVCVCLMRQRCWIRTKKNRVCKLCKHHRAHTHSLTHTEKSSKILWEFHFLCTWFFFSSFVCYKINEVRLQNIFYFLKTFFSALSQTCVFICGIFFSYNYSFDVVFTYKLFSVTERRRLRVSEQFFLRFVCVCVVCLQ